MTLFKSILVATDFSAPADNAVHRAALLARQHDARLQIVHVIDTARVGARERFSQRRSIDLKMADAQERLQRLAAQLPSRYPVAAELEMRSGDVVEELHRASARADLLVIGQRRRHALVERVLGNTAQRLLAHCRRALLVVKQTAGNDYRRALVPIDFTAAADAAAFLAAGLSPEIDLHVFHALDANREAALSAAGARESLRREWRASDEAALIARMRRSIGRLGLDSRKIGFALGRGSPLKATLQQARILAADVLVATRPQSARSAASVPRDVDGLLARSRCDMLIVSGWVRDPRRPQAPAHRWSAARAAGSSSWQVARASAASAARPPSWTRPPLATAASSPAPPHGSRAAAT